jgi:hypothetical protein
MAEVVGVVSKKNKEKRRGCCDELAGKGGTRRRSFGGICDFDLGSDSDNS